LRSFLDSQTDMLLLDSARRRSLSLPEGGNPQSRELARSLRAGVASDRDYLYTVLALFQQQFSYTLSPPLLGENRVDDFLFSTRAGYCEHYASAFTFMMRAAGVPARVVVGYQGGEYNRFEDYMMVYQYNAHAWSEVWLAGEGWVRVDPTSIVAPERISDGVEAALGDDPAFMNESRFSLARFRNAGWLNTLRLRLDAIEYDWNRRVVSYGGDSQLRLFEEWFGVATRNKVFTVLLLTVSLALIFVALITIRKIPGKRGREVDRLYHQYCGHLGRIGLQRKPGEGPMDYLHRVAEQRPDITESLEQVTRLYMEIAYKPQEQARTNARPLQQELRQAIRELRSRLANSTN